MTQTGSSKHGRWGFTLTELVLVIAVAALIGTLTVRLLHALARQQSATTVQLAAGNSAARMRDRFTRDVHLAIDAKVSLKAVELALPDDAIVTWEREGATIVRTLNSNGDVRNDHFDILLEQESSFTRTAIAGGIALVAIELTSNATDSRDHRYVTSSRGTLISAELARDHRWDGMRETQQ